MKLIDTHAHLDFDQFRDDLDAVLDRARDDEVERFVTIGASDGLDSAERALEIAESHDAIRCTAGIHPHDADVFDESVLATLRDTYADHPQVVAIGETGLDFHYDNATVDNQKRSFRAHLELAQEVDKPVVIHSREADEATVEMLEETDTTGGILHCFTGSAWMADAILDRDFYISFSGIVTFDGSTTLRNIARDVPADRLLFETDSPFLAPSPKRGETNQPAYVRHTAEQLAEVRDESLESLAADVWENAARVFDWPTDQP